MNKKDENASAFGCMPMPAAFPYRAVFLQGKPKHEKYDAFWRKHPPMDTVRRAKIFAPFDALAGFGDCIAGKEIEYQEKRSLSEGEKEELDRRIAILRGLTINGKEARKNRPEITVRYFVPCRDPNSSAYGSGGTYESVSGICQKVDIVSRTIAVGDRVLAIDDIAGITSELFEHTADAIP